MYYIEKIMRKNGKTYKPVCELNDIADVILYMEQNNLQYAGTPYILSFADIQPAALESFV